MKLLVAILLLLACISVRADAMREEICQQRAKIFSDIAWLKHQKVKEERAKTRIREIYANVPDNILQQMINDVYRTTQVDNKHPYVVYKMTYEACLKKQND